MPELNSRERIIRTFEGKELDRIATFDIIHNIGLIEHLTGSKVNSKNAEDLLCKAASQVLDMIRHFAVPDYFDTKTVKDEEGFIYKYEWWTGHVVERPGFNSVDDVAKVVEKDISKIHSCTEKKKICDVANMHVNLFPEKYETFEEVKSEYIRISGKLEGTIMVAPEGVHGFQIAQERYGYKWWSYLYYDYPELSKKYFNALYDYELAQIDSFADSDMCPIASHSGSIGSNNRLLWPPEVYRDIILPWDKKIVDRWKKYGTYVIAFLDGYKTPLLGEYIEMGVDAIDPFEPYAGMDVKKFREEYPDTVICQPIDCTQLLLYGTQEEVKDAVNRAIRDAGGKKILIGSISEIHPEVDYRNAITMYETARSYSLK